MQITIAKILKVSVKNTYLRSGQFYYQRAIPRDLRDKYPAARIKINLETSDPLVAAKKVAALDRKHEAEWTLLRADPSTSSQATRMHAERLLADHGIDPKKPGDELDHFFSRLDEKLDRYAGGDDERHRDAEPREFLSSVELAALEIVQNPDRESYGDALKFYLEVHPKGDSETRLGDQRNTRCRGCEQRPEGWPFRPSHGPTLRSVKHIDISVGGYRVPRCRGEGVWAERMMQKDRHVHDKALAEQRAKQGQELAALRAMLDRRSGELLEEVRAELDVSKQKHLKGFHDRLDTYRRCTDIVATILGDLDHVPITGKPLSSDRLDTFNRERIRAYGCLGMIAPQPVIDAFDELIDYLLLVVHEQEPYVWRTTREKALRVLNEIRKDIGIDSSPITYNGNLHF